MSLDEAASYYRHSANSHSAHPRLEGEVRADVCVIGAGFTGLSAALELAERGYSVVVLEARDIGFGASGRNGGQICTGYSSGMATIEAQAGADDARKCWQLAEESKDLIRDRVAAHNIACDLTWGYLNVAPKARAAGELRETQATHEKYGDDGTKILSKAELGDRLGSPVYHGALWEPNAGHLHPLNYCLGLAQAAVAKGARIFENSAVTRVETGAQPAAHTASGTVRAKYMCDRGQRLSRPAGARALCPGHAPSAATSSRPSLWARTGRGR